MLDTERRVGAISAYDILDTPAEPEFDDIVHIAQRVCETPIALVSLVAEHRQWFKARVGLDLDETPIDQSVCRHVLLAEDILVVPDLTADPRTCDNPLVTGPPHIRFYAGAVLRTPDNIAIGSLCVIDFAPRPDGLTAGQAEALKALARQVMSVMALRRAMTARETALLSEREFGAGWVNRAKLSEAAAERLRLDEMRQSDAQDAGGIGTFEIEVATDQCRVSPVFCRIFGLPIASSYAAAEVQSLVLEQDRRYLTTAQGRTDGTVQRDAEFRIRRAKDGAIRWVGRRADFRSDDDGNIRTMVGIVQDVTDRKLVERRANALVGLGDALRDASTVSEVADTSARVLGETLSTSRAAYAFIDVASESLRIDRDWTSPGVRSIAGTYSTATFARTIDRLKDGLPLTIANIPAASWLDGDLATYAAIEARAQIKVPLLRRGQLVGVIFAQSAIPRTWSVAEEEFALAIADRSYAAIAKIEAEDQQRLLNNELSHRLKNMLSMVQAITTQTLRGIGEREVARTLEDRLIALSKAHDVLLQESWTSARITAIVKEVLEPHGHADAVRISGPDLTVGPKAALSISLLLHELTTNAIKYGALSAEAGVVDLVWRVDGGPDPSFTMSWIERGGPPAVTPIRRGFGSRLISMGIAGAGKAKLDYTSAGLRAEFQSPLRTVKEL